jgi:excisionase family DNA binding protein
MPDRTLLLVDPDELERRIEAAVRRGVEARPVAPQWLDSRGAAELLGVCTRTVRNLAKSGDLPASRLGTHWRFRRADLEAWLAGGLAAPPDRDALRRAEELLRAAGHEDEADAVRAALEALGAE